jgi:hypothetical protein
LDAYWRACNYLAAGMIYLRANPLLREPLKVEHIKQRLLGHWGSSPGLSFIYVHLNRLIKKYDLNTIFMAGPGHGAPGVLAPAYLEGTYSEVYPNKGEDEAGILEALLGFGDHYLHLADLKSYLEADHRLTDLYREPKAWAAKAILNVASTGKFSSDRTIAEYAQQIWNAQPCPVA